MANKSHFVSRRGNIENEATGEAYEIFEFQTVSGATRQLRVPRAKSRDALFIYKQLLTLNAELPLFEIHCVAEVQRAIDTEVSARLIYARALGWRNHHRAFTLANEVIGGERRKRRVVPPEWANQSVATGLRCKGTLIGWCKAVAEPAMAFDHLVMVITACFGAPLLKILNQGNFGLNLFGLTPEQRAAAVSVAASGAWDRCCRANRQQHTILARCKGVQRPSANRRRRRRTQLRDQLQAGEARYQNIDCWPPSDTAAEDSGTVVAWDFLDHTTTLE
jgi:hypothetical protein